MVEMDTKQLERLELIVCGTAKAGPFTLEYLLNQLLFSMSLSLSSVKTSLYSQNYLIAMSRDS